MYIFVFLRSLLGNEESGTEAVFTTPDVPGRFFRLHTMPLTSYKR